MIPQFPEFKKLQITDKKDIEEFLFHYPSYSDFDFISMWCWNVNNEMAISLSNNNLVIRFSDYLTGEPFYSFIGISKVSDTANKLLALSKYEGLPPLLKLIPEITIKGMDLVKLSVVEDRDNFDYIFGVNNLLKYQGSALKTQRNLFTHFCKLYPTTLIKELDISDKNVQKLINSLYHDWERNKGYLTLQEAVAIQRLFDSVNYFKLITIGVFIENKLIAFSINNKYKPDTSNSLFAKADVSYQGVYSFLMNALAKVLLKYDCKFINYEQDLGIYNLKQAKNAFSPIDFLKKYRVGYQSDI